MLDQARINIFKNLYIKAIKEFNITKKQSVDAMQRPQQIVIALDNIIFSCHDLDRLEFNDLAYNAKTNHKINIKQLPITKPLDKRLIKKLRHLYWQALIAERSFIDDLQGMDQTKCSNPNYESRLEGYRQVFDAWQVPDKLSYHDMDALIKTLHYTQVIDKHGGNNYRQINLNKQIVTNPILPDNI